ncbi:MAG: UbiA prenyltransferase family protein [Deltaproteobacteria bacterium]|nr:UbiA prenyltransferase family protein [Deltaproteobacteria bacterium]
MEMTQTFFNALWTRARRGLSRLSLFLALSRTPHLLLDLAAPSLAALLCLGAFPPPWILLLGLLTAYAGYSAVYALNDLIDCRSDRSVFASPAAPQDQQDLDRIFARHPLASGLLSHREAVVWTAAWSGVALVGSYLLNPLCPVIFLLASLLEVIYCSLLKVTWLKSIISGLVKTSGPIAAAFAVNPDPPLPFLALLFLWLFFWEIGGQNVPNDLTDLSADRRIAGQTIPVRFAPRGAIAILTVALLLTLTFSWLLLPFLPTPPGAWYRIGVLFSGFYFLLMPCYHLCRTGRLEDAFPLFNRASVYPLSVLAFTVLDWVF